MNPWRHKIKIMNLYDLTAHMYDMRYAEEQVAKIKEAMKRVNVNGTSVVLDLGCGTGLLFDYVAEKVAMIVGVDISRGLMVKAKARASKLGNVHLILADADYMPFSNGIFSHIFAFTVLQNMPNPKHTLKEVNRVAAENASIIVTGLKKKFPIHVFLKLLEKAGLKAINIIGDREDLKCHLAICMKTKAEAST